jgi:hypothetical protein
MASKALFTHRMPAVSLILAAAVAGCDNEHGKADKKVDQDLQTASMKSAGTISSRPVVKDFTGLGAPIDYTEYHAAVEAAAAESAATPPEQIRAKTLLAHDELRTALELANQASATSAVIDRLSLQVQAQVRDIQKNTADIAGLQLQDPKAVSATLKEAGDLASGATGKTAWVTTASGELLSQAAVDKQSTETQSKISDIQNQINTDTTQRTQLVSDADKFSEQAEAATGDKAVALYTQGSDARKKAADLTVKIDQNTVLLDRAKADLAGLQTQHTVAQNAVGSYGEMGKTIDAAWSGVQEHMAAIKAKSAAIMGNDDPAADPEKDKNASNGGDTISSKLKTIEMLTAENKKTRSLALSHFNAAIGKYQEAYRIANTLKSDLTTEISAPANANKASVVAWQAEQDALSPLNYLLDEANASSDLANFLGRGVEDDLTMRHLAEVVSPVLEKADLVPPKAMPSVDDAKMKEAAKAVAAAFKTATDQSKQVADGAPPRDRKNAARAIAAFSNYSWYLFDVISGAEDDKAAKEHFGDAVTDLKLLAGDNVYFNNMPQELADAVPQAPSSTPGGAPAAPAGAGTTPDATTPGFGGVSAAPAGAPTASPTAAPAGAPTAAPTAASMVGSYSVKGPAPNHPGGTFEIDLTLKADGTFENRSGGSKDGTTPKPEDMLVVLGTYTVDGTNLMMKTNTVDGKPPPPMPGADQPHAWKIEDGGKHVTDPDGNTLTKQ